MIRLIGNIAIVKKFSISTILVLLIGLSTTDIAYAAAPANDAICSATTLPVNGTCLTAQRNSEATADIYAGCISSNYPSVWYTFTLSGPTVNAIDITFANVTGGSNVALFLLSGTCAAPSGISTDCDLTGNTFSFYNLSDGVTYWLEVSTQPGGGNELDPFDICATEYDGVGSITGPEQDCPGAIPICVAVTTQANSYVGIYNIDDVPDGATCLSSGENNSVWYIFTAQSTGDLEFELQTSKDYDWSIYDISSGGCGIVSTATPRRCNFSGTAGNTGLVLPTSATLNLSEGGMGSPTMAGIQMTQGETFVLIIDNWTGDNSGFVLDFKGSPIVDVTDPTLSSASTTCGANTILVTMNEDIMCLSVAQDDFKLFNNTNSTDYSSNITQVIGFNCPISSGAMTNQIQITHDGTIPSGNYKVEINTNPSLADKCGNVIAVGGSVAFDYLGAITMSANTNTICSSGDPVTLDADGVDGAPALATYTYNPGGATNTTNGIQVVNPTSTSTYTVEVTYGGCMKTASQSITLQNNVIVSISPTDPQVCPAGTATLSATTTINGVACPTCTYVWSTAETTSSITAGVGTYTVQATTPETCNSQSPDPSSEIVLASGSTSTCNIYFVSVTGGGDGLTKSTPTDLATAISNAACTNSILKLEAGVYLLTDRQIVTSFMTIEGGYYNTYANKSSDLAGGANTTIIRRNSKADSDDANACTAFKLGNNSADFEFRNLRIELPGSPSVTGHEQGDGITNYGIRMGTACTGYSIVRCYINTGVGAE